MTTTPVSRGRHIALLLSAAAVLAGCTSCLLPVSASASSPPASAAPTTQGADHTGTTRTYVAGGLEGTPPALPTAFDLSKGNFKIIGHAIWDGSWVGVSIFTANDVHMDYATGDYSFHAVDVFRGVWLGDHSRGTLTWDEDAHGNFITGATYANVDIVSGDGDPSFQCSSGHFVWDGFAPVPASYGGYSGTWIHGCRGARR